MFMPPHPWRPDCVYVALMSGRSVQLEVKMGQRLMDVKLRAQTALQTGNGILRNFQGRILDERETLGQAGLKPGDTLTLQVRQTAVAGGRSASSFSSIMGDGRVVTCGHLVGRGASHPFAVQEQLRHVQNIQATAGAFAAVLEAGSVVTWGHPGFGGDSRLVQEQLSNVRFIQATVDGAFAAVYTMGLWSPGEIRHVAAIALWSRSSSRMCSTSRLPGPHLLLFCTTDGWSHGGIGILVAITAK